MTCSTFRDQLPKCALLGELRGYFGTTVRQQGPSLLRSVPTRGNALRPTRTAPPCQTQVGTCPKPGVLLGTEGERPYIKSYKNIRLSSAGSSLVDTAFPPGGARQKTAPAAATTKWNGRNKPPKSEREMRGKGRRGRTKHQRGEPSTAAPVSSKNAGVWLPRRPRVGSVAV